MPDRRLQLILFFATTALIAAAGGIHEATFNNYLRDGFDLSPGVRGALEFPRELPGLLVVLMTGVLCMLSVTGLGIVGAAVFCVGSVGLAYTTSYGGMVAMMIIGSAGMHLLQPVGGSIALGLSDPDNRGRRMGQAGAVGTVGMILGTGAVWWLFDKEAPQYQAAFLGIAALALAAGVIYAFMRIPHLRQSKAQFVIRRKFTLYYILELLFGARKQIFITFGPWVLIQVYGEPANAIAGLLMIAAIIGIVFKPLAGVAIDRFGERTVMVIDGLALAVVCLGYGYALRLFGSAERALPVAAACFILDNLLFSLGTSRAVYMARLAESSEEVTSTLAMGVSVNHIASMVIPAIAGVAWVWLGYELLFLAAAGLALVISAVACWVPPRAHWLASETAEAPAGP